MTEPFSITPLVIPPKSRTAIAFDGRHSSVLHQHDDDPASLVDIGPRVLVG